MTSIDVDELMRVLPKLIRENDTIKGAIITALSRVVATREDIRELIEAMDKRFEAMDKRFEAMDKRFEAMDKRFEAMDKRFDAMDKRFDEQKFYFDRRLNEISIGADVSFELFCKEVIKEIFKSKGITIPYIESIRHFKDINRLVHKDTTDVEIDLFCPDPKIIGEVLYKVISLRDLEIFLKKIELMEKEIFKGRSERFFCTLEIDPNIYNQFHEIAKTNDIQIITKEKII